MCAALAITLLSAGCAQHALVPASPEPANPSIAGAFQAHALAQNTLVENDNDFSGSPSLQVMPPPYTRAQKNVSGLNDPQTLALDAKNDLFVANVDGTVLEFAPPYRGLPRRTIATGSGGAAVAVDPAGDLFVAGVWGENLVEYAPPYTTPKVQNDLCPASACAAGAPITLSRDGHAFLAGTMDPYNVVLAYAPPYTGTPAAIGNGNLGLVVALAANSQNELFVADRSNNVIDVYAAPYTRSPLAVRRGVESPYALTVDAKDRLYAVMCWECQTQWIAEYAPPYTKSPIVIKNLRAVTAIVADAAGHLFVGDANGVDIYTGTKRTATVAKGMTARNLVLTR